jgi:hypothetical protein
MLTEYGKLWNKIYSIIKDFPGYFPGTKSHLEKVFRWSYMLVLGR